MNIGLNIGYSHTKAYAGIGRNVNFPSVTGTPDRAHFSLGGTEGIALLTPQAALVGEEAVLQSRFLNRREDRAFTQSQEWYTLFLAALSELTTGTPEAMIVTGLPVAFYAGDKETVKARLEGAHTFQREGRQRQTVTVTRAVVVPEPFGTLFDNLWDDSGRVSNPEVATGNVGVIDIGGKTTNILSVRRLKEIGRETASVNVGAWDVIRAVRTWLETECPKLELRDHEIVEAVIAERVKYYGKPLNLNTIIKPTLEHLSAQIIAQAGQLWNQAAGLDSIIITGGGALLLGAYIQAHPDFPHACVVSEPVLSNARGFWKYARHLSGKA